MLLLVAAHFSRGIIALLSSAPSLVREYSTRGGISAKDSLLISPSACSSFNVSDNVFGLIPSNSFIRPLNLSGSHNHKEEHGYNTRFLTKAERVEKLRSYAEELKKELAAVEEHIKELSG